MMHMLDVTPWQLQTAGVARRNCAEEKWIRPHGRDPDNAAKLWTLSESLTGTKYSL